MSIALDPSTDFAAVIDGLAALTLERRGADSESIARALRRELTRRELEASNGQFTAGDTRFHFAASAVSDAPRVGDVLVDANGDRFTILQVQLATLAKRYQCVARNLAVHYGLDTSIAVERATYAKGTQGAIERTWTTWKRVRARVQPVSAASGATAGAMRTNGRWKIFLAEPLELDARCRFKTADGTIYTYVGHSRAEDVAGLTTVEVQ